MFPKEHLRDISCHSSRIVAEWSQKVCFVTFHSLNVLFTHNVTAEACWVERTLYLLQKTTQDRDKAKKNYLDFIPKIKIYPLSYSTYLNNALDIAHLNSIQETSTGLAYAIEFPLSQR